MSIELKMLAWSVCLGLIHIAIASLLSTQQRGLKWNVSNRDDDLKPLTGLAARAERASRNFLETFPFFLAAVLAMSLKGAGHEHGAVGAQLYFWGRLAYLPVYLIGIPYLRTGVWAVSIAGLLMLIGQWLQ